VQPDVSGLDPAGVSALLGGGLPPSLVRRLLLAPRFGGRLAMLAENRLEKLPEKLSVAQRVSMDLDKWGLQGVYLRAGAIWHAKLIAGLISGPAVRALVGGIGPDLRNLALKYRTLAPSEESADISMIAGLIEPQGIACFKAWAMQQPESINQRLSLRLPRRPVPDDSHLKAAPDIIETLLKALAT
jgi:hypothetical protein